MSQSNPNTEPTMDEILASIRNIISEDQPEAQEASAPEAVAPQPSEDAVVQETPAAELNEAAGAVGDEPARLDALAEDSESDGPDSIDFGAPDIGVPDESMEEPLEEDLPQEEPFEGGIISPATRLVLDQAFEQIEAEPPPEPITASSDASVEAVFARAVQEAFDPTLQEWVDNHGEEIVSRLAPLIRGWMDKNLPPLVEAAVTKEISRAVRSRRR